MVDKLNEIYDLQKALHDRVTKENPRFPTTFEQKMFAIAYAIQNEATEAQNSLNWKWWKQRTDVDIEELKEEWIDLFHFWLDGAIELNMTPNDIKRIYKKKNQVNHKRQDDGY